MPETQNLDSLLTLGNLFNHYHKAAGKKEKESSSYIFEIILAKIEKLADNKVITPECETITEQARHFSRHNRSCALMLYSCLIEQSRKLESLGCMDSAVALMGPAIALGLYPLGAGRSFTAAVARTHDLAQKAADPKSPVAQRLTKAAARAEEILANLTMLPVCQKTAANAKATLPKKGRTKKPGIDINP